MFFRAPLALLAVVLPLTAAARLATVPLEVITVAVPAAVPAAPLCHEPTDELAAAGTCAMCATCHVPPAAAAPAPAATGSGPRPAAAPAPREAERRNTRRQAERLDRPPFIRPM
jgi:hypothetical protein